jgi:hypothetical protein
VVCSWGVVHFIVHALGGPAVGSKLPSVRTYLSSHASAPKNMPAESTSWLVMSASNTAASENMKLVHYVIHSWWWCMHRGPFFTVYLFTTCLRQRRIQRVLVCRTVEERRRAPFF